MSSYVNKKSRAFNQPGSTKVIQKRSESRLKSIKSATDNRAWTDCVEDRRQYILELIKTKAGGLSLGKYIPIEVIIDCLLANKNAQIAELQRQLDAYKKLKLTDDQLRQLSQMGPGGEKKAEPTLPPPPKAETAKVELPKPEVSKPETAKDESPKPELSKVEPVEIETSKAEPLPSTKEQEAEEVETTSETMVSIEPRVSQAKPEPSGAEPAPGASKKDEPEATVIPESSEETREKRSTKESWEDLGAPTGQDVLDPDAPLRKEFQKIVVGDVNLRIEEVSAKYQGLEEMSTKEESSIKDESELGEPSESTDDSLKKQFIEISETVGDGDVEKGQLEMISTKEEGVNCDDLILSLQKKLEDQIRANKLAERAIKQLESIKEIISSSGLCSGEAVLCNLTCKNVCKPCPTLVKKANELDNKKQQLEDLMRERDELRLKVSQLEEDLFKARDLPDKIKQFAAEFDEEISTIPPEQLQKRLDQVIGLEANVQDLVNQITNKEITCATTEKEASKEPPKQPPKDLTKDLEKCKSKIGELEKELENLRLVKAENVTLKLKIQELSHLEMEHRELKKNLSSMEGENKSKYQSLCNMEKECISLRNQLENVKLLQKEKDMLQRQVGDLECCIADLEDEIKRLVGHIDRLTEGRDEQQARTQNVMADIRAELEKKTSLIEISEEKLAFVQEKLEKSINGVTTETSCYKSKIDNLEKIVAIKEEQIAFLNTNLEEKDNIINNLNRIKKANEELAHAEDSTIKSLKLDLDNSMKQNEKLQKELEKMVAFKSDETSMQKMLVQSRAAIKRVREEIDRQYKEWESGAGEDCESVQELKGRMKLLETEVTQMKIINDELKGALKNQKKCNCLAGLENNALKKHSTEIQNIAKHQVEELLEHLKRAQLRIIQLEELLEDVKVSKLKPETKDSEISCDCDKEELERLMKENELLKRELQTGQDTLKAQVPEEPRKIQKSGSGIDQDLLNEIQRLKNEKASLESDKLKLEKENENLKTKSQFSNKDTGQTSIHKLLEEAEREKQRLENSKTSMEEEIAKLKKEIDTLKEALAEAKRQLGTSDTKAQASSLNLQKLEDLNGKLEETNKKLKTEIENLKKALAECQASGKTSPSPDEGLKKENDNFRKEIEGLRNDLREMEQMKKKLAECLENEKKAKPQVPDDGLKKDNDNLKKANDDLMKKLKEMEQTKNQLSEKLDDARNKVTSEGSSQKEVENLRKENDNLRNSLKEIEELKKQLADCLQKDKEAKTQGSPAEDTLRRENGELKEKLKDMEKFKKELADCLEREKKARGDADNALKKLEDSNSAAKKEVDKLKAQLAECLDREKKAKELADKESFQSAVQVQQKDLDKLESDNSSLKAEINQLKKKLAEAEKKAKEAPQSAVPGQSKELERLENDNKNMKNEIEQLKKKLAEAEKKAKEEPSKQQPSPQSAVPVQSKEVERLENDNKNMKNEMEQLKKKLAEAEKKAKEEESKQQPSPQSAVPVQSKEFERLENDNKNMKNEIEQLKKKLAEAEKKAKGDPNAQVSSNLNDELNQMKKKLTDNEDELNELRKKMKECLENESKLKESSKIGENEPSKKLGKREVEEQVLPDIIGASNEELQAEIERLRNQLEKQRTECNENIKMLKEQYDRDAKNLKNTNRVSIDKLQKQHAAQIQEIESQHDSLVKSLSKELTKSQLSMERPIKDDSMDEIPTKDRVLSTQTFCICSEMPRIVPIITTLGADIGVHEVESPYDRPGRWPKPRIPQDSVINQILYKAIYGGMETLSMDELKIIHSELVQATAKLKGKVLRPRALEAQDPLSLMDKIEELEDNLQRKHRSAKQKAVSLHMSIRSVEKRISEMRNVLEKEKEHNAELRARLVTMELDSQMMQVERDLMKQQTSFQDQQIAKLQTNYQSSRSRIRELESDRSKKKVVKKLRKGSSTSDSAEVLDRRMLPLKKRSTSTPPSSLSGRIPHLTPQGESSDRREKVRRTKKGGCHCCAVRGCNKSDID